MTKFNKILRSVSNIEGMTNFILGCAEDPCHWCKHYYEFDKVYKDYMDISVFCQYKCHEGIKELLLEEIEDEN